MQPLTPARFHRGPDRILGGVCSGLAEGFRIDPLWMRVAFVLLAFVQGVGIFLYVVLWLVMPEQVEGESGSRSGFDSMTADLHRLWSEVSGRPSGQAPAAAGAQPEPGAAPAPSQQSPARNGWRDQPALLGVALVVIGAVFLGNNTGLVDWNVVWPVAVIALGVVLVLRNARRHP